MPPIDRPALTRDAFVATFGTGTIRYAEALAAGFTRASLDSAVRHGSLVRPRHGRLRVAHVSEADLRAAHVPAIRAVLAGAGNHAVVSHDSAALVHGMARPASAVPDEVQLATTRGAGFTSPGLIVRATPVPARDRCLVDDIPCTGLARTAVDLARGRPLPSALAPLDSAARLLIKAASATSGNDLRKAVRTPELRAYARAELDRALAVEFGWSGTVAVREAIPHVDPASESAAESRSRGWFIGAGLGPLNPGTPIRCASSTYWADFCSPEHRVVGEVDGWSKYGGTAEEMREAMERERRRQRDLERDGWRLIRWTSTERRPTVLARMSDALRWA